MLCMYASSGMMGTAVCPGQLLALLFTSNTRRHHLPSLGNTSYGYHAVQVLQFVHGIVAPLADVPVAELALQIYLQAAYSASEVAHLEMIAYEFMEQVWFLTLT